VNLQPILIAQVEPPQNEEGGDYYYRTLAPGRAMAREEGVFVINLTNIHRKKEKIMRSADVLVLKNVCDPDLLPLIRERKARKRLTVFEIADDINAVQPWNPVYFFYRNPENFSLSRRLARLSDAMQFTVAELKTIYGYLNPVNEVFPNQIAILPPEKAGKKRDGLVIGWGGSHGHLEDMAEIAPVLVRWIWENKGVHLHLMCSEPIWELFKEVPSEKKKWVKPGAIEDFYAFLKTIDIGLAPLRDTAFNRSRSDVKFLEYAVSGVVAVVQDAIPYREVIRDGETGFLYRRPEELTSILDSLNADRERMERVAKNARAYVHEERLQKNHGSDRSGFYRRLLSEIGWRHSGNKEKYSEFKALARMEGAIREDRYLRLMPTRFESLLQDGLVLAQVDGERARAQTHFAEASRMEPKNYLPCLFGANSTPDAIMSLQHSLTLNPGSIKAWILLGEAYARQGNAFASLKAFASAAELFPEYEIPYARVASVLMGIGEKQAAEDMAKKSQALAVL
jgi:glycosyltransferase involved in cell wall biosynthesis